MSGLEVVGGISAVIAIIDASIKVYQGAKSDAKLPETFRTIADRLPLLLSTLQTCHDQLYMTEASIPKDVTKSFLSITQRCKAQARSLRDIFEETIPGENAGRLERYKTSVKSLGKGKRVEELVLSISEDIRVVVDYQSVKSAQPELSESLEDLINEIKDMKPSIPEERLPSSKTFFNTNNQGDQTISTGDYNNSGPGNQTINNGGRTVNQYRGQPLA